MGSGDLMNKAILPRISLSQTLVPFSPGFIHWKSLALASLTLGPWGFKLAALYLTDLIYDNNECKAAKFKWFNIQTPLANGQCHTSNCAESSDREHVDTI